MVVYFYFKIRYKSAQPINRNRTGMMGYCDIVVIWKAPVEFERQLSHHEEHEDHEGKTEHIDIPSSFPSCPSWLNVCDLSFLHIRILYL